MAFSDFTGAGSTGICLEIFEEESTAGLVVIMDLSYVTSSAWPLAREMFTGGAY